jgi:hypothetical protein
MILNSGTSGGGRALLRYYYRELRTRRTITVDGPGKLIGQAVHQMEPEHAGIPPVKRCRDAVSVIPDNKPGRLLIPVTGVQQTGICRPAR